MKASWFEKTGKTTVLIRIEFQIGEINIEIIRVSKHCGGSLYQ